MRQQLLASLVAMSVAVPARAQIVEVRAPALSVIAAPVAPAPTPPSAAAPSGLSACPVPMLAPALAPLPAPTPVSAAPVAQVATAVSAALKDAGDLSKAGTGDARDLGDRVQALLGGGGAASTSEAPAGPVAARTPVDALYARIRAVPLNRYKATFGPRLGVPGDNVITVVGRGKTWMSYPIYGDNFDKDKDGETIRFVAKLEKTLNGGRVHLSDLDVLAKDSDWPSKLDSPRHVAINARKLTRYSAVLKLWPGMDNAFRISIAGPGKTWESQSVHWDNIRNQKEAALFVAKLEQALNAGRVKLSALKKLTRDANWPENIGKPAYAKIRAEKLTRYQAKLSAWAAVPGNYLLEITGPEGYLSLGSVRGDDFTGDKDRAAARFVAQVEVALNTHAVTFQELKALHLDENRLDKIN